MLVQVYFTVLGGHDEHNGHVSLCVKIEPDNAYGENMNQIQ